MNQKIIDNIIINALNEDIPYMDVTSDYLLDDIKQAEAVMRAKAKGVVAGVDVAKRVFELMDSELTIKILKNDGSEVVFGDLIMSITGSAKSILKAERVSLNLIQRMSGIATMSNYYSNIVKDYDVRIVDTRKTTPGLRIIEKYAVRVGGCHNHRYNLSDAVMIKDNHIEVGGGIKASVDKIRSNIPHTMKIEVEVQNLEQLKEAIDAGADIIMLDNMDTEKMEKAVEINNGKEILEASGGITDERLVEIAKAGVDVISVGALTHSVKALDISLLINFK